MTEKVNHPVHYGGQNAMEVINVIEHYDLNFNLGNVIKYVLRAGKKNGSAYTEDLQKAAWYLNRQIENNKNECFTCNEK